MSFVIIATILFLLLGFVWKRGDWLNLFIKFLFYVMAGWGAFLVLQGLGYVLKT